MNLTTMLENSNKEKIIKDVLLKKHPKVNKSEEHIHHQFILILAAALSSQQPITDIQSGLFKSIINNFEINNNDSEIFNEIRDIHPDKIIEAISVVKKAGWEKILLLDCNILFITKGSLDDESGKLLGELASATGVDITGLTKISREANEIIGLSDSKSPDILKTIKIGTESKKLTEDVLSEGINGGVWYLDKNLEVNFPWEANDAIFIFEKSACLITDTSRATYEGTRKSYSRKNAGTVTGEMKIKNCKFVNASIIFHGGDVFIDSCEFQGSYLRKDLATVLTIEYGSLHVSNSKFYTPKACAIQAKPFEYKVNNGYEQKALSCKLYVENCEFLECGHVDMMAGVLIAHNVTHENNCFISVTNSKFTNCNGFYAGAIYIPGYGTTEIKKCEFINCKSRSRSQEIDGLNFIAVRVDFARRLDSDDDSIINNCVFQNTSLELYKSNQKIIMIKDSVFNDALVILTNSGYGTQDNNIKNCTFNNGKIIEN